jgi:hypothetical protein
MRDGYDIENRLSSQHGENSKIEEIMHCEFNEEHWNLEEINSNEIYILSTGSTYNSRNDNTNENNDNNKNINSDNYFQNENNEYNKEINTDNYYQNENNESNKDINSDNHFQINQNIINKKRKRNIISEEKKQNMGRKKKDFCGVSKHNKYSEDNQIKKIERNFTNFCPKHVKMASGGNFEIKKTERECFNRDFYLKLLPSSIEDYFSKKISPKYTKNREPNEETINILKMQYPELKDFLEQKFNDGLKKYINGYYDSMYENPADNKYLFSQLKIDEKEKEIWKRLIDEDLYDYFLKKKGRKTIDKED